MAGGRSGPRPKPQLAERLGEWWNTFSRALRTPVGGTVVTILLIVTGTLGSLYSTEIRTATPFEWDALWSRELSPFSILFWCAVVLTSLLYLVRASAGQRSMDELVEILRTQPPSDLLDVFKETYESCESVAHDASEPIATRIRTVLSGLGLLAQRFDGAAASVRYATNVMLFKPTASAPEDVSKRLEAYLLYRAPESPLGMFKGVLLLQPELSTVVPNVDPDDGIARIAFQIPHDDNLKTPLGKWRVIPGAPMAYVRHECDSYLDAKHLVSWVEANADFGDGFRVALDDYFRKHGEHVQSFVSLPLGERGVVNIHRNRPGMLKGEQKLKHFLPLVAPFVLLLQSLLKEWTDPEDLVETPSAPEPTAPA